MTISSNSDLAAIRSIISKRYLTNQDIQSIISIISNNHIYVFKYLAKFFIHLRNQLIHSDQILEENNVVFDQEILNFPYLNFQRRYLAHLAEIIIEKITLYVENTREKPFFQNLKQNEGKKQPQQNIENGGSKIINHKNSKKSKMQKILCDLYPEAYFLQKTIQQLSFMKTYYEIIPDRLQIKQTDFIKDKITIQIHSKLQDSGSIVNSHFHKQFAYENQPQKLTDHQFFSIKQHEEKVCLNLDEGQNIQRDRRQKRTSQFIQQVHKLTTISAKCAGCIPFLYKNRKLPRQRCSMMNVEVVNTLDDKRDIKRFKQIVQTFINSKNGGIIFFDCQDLFYSIKPKGYECSLKIFQQKKQSLIDNCKNLFPDLKIDKQFYIDFVTLKDPEVLMGKRNRNDTKTGIEIIGRFRVLKGKLTTNFDRISTSHYIKKLSNQQIRKLQMQRKVLNEPNKMEEILIQLKFKSEFQILPYIQGRGTPIFRHSRGQCKQKPLQIYEGHEQQTTTNSYEQIKTRGFQQVQRFFIGKQPLSYTDKYLPFWTLLVVNVAERQKIDWQLNDCLKPKNINYEIETPFQDCQFPTSKKTMLIKTSCQHQLFVEIITSAEAKQNKYFCTMKKQQVYMPLVYIKVYDFIMVSFNREKTTEQIFSMCQQLQYEVQGYFQRKFSQIKRRQRSNKYQDWVKQLKIKIYSHQSKPLIYIGTNDWNPSYALLFIYFKLRNYRQISKDKDLKKVQLKQYKDFSNQKVLRLIEMY